MDAISVVGWCIKIILYPVRLLNRWLNKRIKSVVDSNAIVVDLCDRLKAEVQLEMVTYKRDMHIQNFRRLLTQIHNIHERVILADPRYALLDYNAQVNLHEIIRLVLRDFGNGESHWGFYERKGWVTMMDETQRTLNASITVLEKVSK